MRRLLVPAAACLVTVAGCGGDAEPPSWFGQRAELPSCGVDEPERADYPNLTARQCFREAYAADRPAELTVRNYGDEGESIRAHFRVLGDGRYEIVGQHFPGAVEYAAGQGWVRYECERFVFIDDPNPELLDAPLVDGDGACTIVEEVSG